MCCIQSTTLRAMGSNIDDCLNANCPPRQFSAIVEPLCPRMTVLYALIRDGSACSVTGTWGTCGARYTKSQTAVPTRDRGRHMPVTCDRRNPGSSDPRQRVAPTLWIDREQSPLRVYRVTSEKGNGSLSHVPVGQVISKHLSSALHF